MNNILVSQHHDGYIESKVSSGVSLIWRLFMRSIRFILKLFIYALIAMMVFEAFIGFLVLVAIGAIAATLYLVCSPSQLKNLWKEKRRRTKGE